MIIWINGTFGSGKSTTAYELHRRIKESHVYDPERFGYVLMRNVPMTIAKSDFQDYPLWREANYKLLKQIAEQYSGILIVPMTLTNEVYFNQIVGRLRVDGIEIKHFTLSATEETIEKRLKKRLEGKNSWAHKQMAKRLESLEKDIFQEQIYTDSMTIDEVVETIARRSGIELLPDSRTKLKKTMDRLSTGIKEFGIFK
ncbi:AAA family ATPase [Lederbergia wuyishanensis]|uniref:Kinase n=1 Tax=Lederbergia wuyishanensis TaxID=1347903 RepID=A0ABU0D5X1_9BACI|nr:AAA family ATPase [Lederbergia wuyishanensis]MCJ8008389.1 ATP-binding protein [Lederbergia wuyishanensis]MDQ0343804.1 putative kinase [Lederbergia wuyishanensis]